MSKKSPREPVSHIFYLHEFVLNPWSFVPNSHFSGEYVEILIIKWGYLLWETAWPLVHFPAAQIPEITTQKLLIKSLLCLLALASYWLTFPS